MVETTQGGSVTFLRRLTEAGIDDVLILNRKTAEDVLTEKRLDIIDAITTNKIESVRALARHLDRDVSIVSRDLDVLFESGIIDFEEEGRAKRPVLAHETIMIEPLVFEDSVLSEPSESEEELPV
jgi:DNA-binding transcriptional ArsR family regulator